MNDAQLLRYSRHIMLPQVDLGGQERLLKSRVMIVGLGGLGSPVAMYLAASGVGHLVLVDHDDVDLTNLQRQIIHRTGSIGHRKVDSAAEALHRLNPDVVLSSFDRKLEGRELAEQVAAADAVVDASDNFATRFQLNEACVAHKTPLISGAVIRMEAQMTVFQPALDDSPCYRCLYHDVEAQAETCSETGILAPMPGIVGAVQATETIKVLLNLPGTLTGRLLILDGTTMEWRTVKLKKDPACPVCA